MMDTALIDRVDPMAPKKSDRKTVMVRAYEDFAEEAKRGAGERGQSLAEYLSNVLLPCAKKAHRDHITQEAKKLAKEGD